MKLNIYIENWNQRLLAYYVQFDVGICTTVCAMCLSQMVALYRDPKGENVLKSNDATLGIKPTLPDTCSRQESKNGTPLPGKTSCIGTMTTATDDNNPQETSDNWLIHCQYSEF